MNTEELKIRGVWGGRGVGEEHPRIATEMSIKQELVHVLLVQVTH